MYLNYTHVLYVILNVRICIDMATSSMNYVYPYNGVFLQSSQVRYNFWLGKMFMLRCYVKKKSHYGIMYDYILSYKCVYVHIDKGL